jgi:hypothetical protein
MIERCVDGRCLFDLSTHDEDVMTEHYWSRFSADYDERQAKVVGSDLLEAISDTLDTLPELGEVVELGCGTGYVTRQLAP